MRRVNAMFECVVKQPGNMIGCDVVPLGGNPDDVESWQIEIPGNKLTIGEAFFVLMPDRGIAKRTQKPASRQRERKTKPSAPLSPGEAFVEKHDRWFGCGGCKRDVAAVINRWVGKSVTAEQIQKVADTIANKKRVDSDQASLALRAFLESRKEFV